MMPLYWAGAGLFKGFALTTIIGVTAAILVTRPAFADIIRKIDLFIHAAAHCRIKESIATPEKTFTSNVK